VRIAKQRAVWLSLVFLVVFTGLLGSASGASADPFPFDLISGATDAATTSSPPDLSHPSRPAIPEDRSPRSRAPSGVTNPVVVDPAVSNTNSNFASTDTNGGTEPSVALNPANPNQVVITSFSMPPTATWGGTQNAPLWYSTDGGATWTQQFTITPPPGRPSGCPCDQTVDYSRNGTLFGSILIPSTTANRFDVVTGDTTNPAQASSWQWNGNPAQLTNNAHAGNVDQPWMLVNRDPVNAGQDDVWGAYDDFGTNPVNAQVAVSNNAAPPNFTVDNSPGTMANSGTNPGLRLAKDPRNGAMYALWQTTTGTTNPHPTTLHINRSTDGGANWTLNGNAGGQALPAGQADDGCTTYDSSGNCTAAYKFGGVNALLGGVHHVTVDPTNGDVYVVYGNDNANTGNGNQILIRRLTDNGAGGLTIGAPLTVSNAASAALPSVAVTADGTIGVLYDTSDGNSSPPGNFPRFSAHLSVSTDHGATFNDTVLETFLSPCGPGASTTCGNQTSTGQRVLGDYQQIKADGDLLFGVFSGNRVPLNGGTGTSIIDPIYFSADTGISATGGFTVNATEGLASSPQTVATFTDPDANATAAEYSATIDWGDSSSSAGTITGAAGGPFTVSGSHTYAEEGPYDVKVTINDVDNSVNTATVHSTANVADAPLTSACAAPPVSLQAFAGPTATFTDADPGGTSSDYTATIDWGDSSTSAGTVSPGTGNGPYTVSGAHTYTTTGTFTITTTIKDAGGSQTVATCKTLVFAFAPGGGSFVIGDRNSATGTHVTFWGAQWWKKNSLSGGKPPPSFKGFAENPAQPSCGPGWSADPGNSTPPPNGPLPADMGVIVTSKATKSGSQISGNTVHIVVVKVDPGYQPNPGHAGTGTVEAQVC
jgi:hypothetical protein